MGINKNIFILFALIFSSNCLATEETTFENAENVLKEYRERRREQYPDKKGRKEIVKRVTTKLFEHLEKVVNGNHEIQQKISEKILADGATVFHLISFNSTENSKFFSSYPISLPETINEEELRADLKSFYSTPDLKYKISDGFFRGWKIKSSATILGKSLSRRNPVFLIDWFKYRVFDSEYLNKYDLVVGFTLYKK